MGKRIEKVKTAANKAVVYGQTAVDIISTVVNVATLTKEVINKVANQKKK